MLRFPMQGRDLVRARVIRRRVIESLVRLVAYMTEGRRFDHVKALRIEPALAGPRAAVMLTRIVARYGFEVALDGGAPPAGSWLFRVFDNLWMSLLAWTFNPVGRERWRSDRRRRQFLISP